MRIFKTLSLGAAIGIMTACGAAGTDARATSQAASAEAVLDVVDAQALAPNWAVRADESSIVFKAKQTGDEFSGEFSSFTADITFNPDAVEAASVKAVIDMSSFDAGSKDRNSALPGKEWFSVKKFPDAVFTSEDFVSTGETSYDAVGSLTLRGVSLPLTVPFELVITDGVANMTGVVSLDRSAFGVGQGAWAKGEWVDLNVAVEITIVADKV